MDEEEPRAQVIRPQGIPSAEAFGTPKVAMASNLWVKWIEIAAEHARLAGDSRDRAKQVVAQGSDPAEAFDGELKASLVAITAAAFAIDAWDIAVAPMFRKPVVGPGAGRHAWVLEALKIGFDLGPAAARWGKPMKRLYGLRDKVVHHDSVFHDAQPHPAGGSNVAQENATYTAEEAINAVDFAIDVVTTCLVTPRKPHADLVAWCKENDHVAQLLADKRRHELGAKV